MEKKYVLLTLFVFVFLLTNIFDGVGFCLRAIPNAPFQQGFGIDTPGGSGRHLGTPSTTIYKVTNLNDSGPGSLRYGLEEVDSPKVIIFEVSGNIELLNKIHIGKNLGANAKTKGSYITIAGQTAPSPGITLKNYGLQIARTTHDILIQHIRIRPGDVSVGGIFPDGWSDDGNGVWSHALIWPQNREPDKVWYNEVQLTEEDGAGPSVAQGNFDWAANFLYVHTDEDPANGILRYAAYKSDISNPLYIEGSSSPAGNLVIDHCSFSWGGDMNVIMSGNNITFINCISSEALNSPLHVKSSHSKGMGIFAHQGEVTGCHYVMINQNIFVHNVDRNPLVDSGMVVVANNLKYDVGLGVRVNDHTTNEGYVKLSISGNYMIETHITSAPMYICAGTNKATRIYLANDNYFRGAIQTDPWNTGLKDTQERLWYGEPDSDVPDWARASSPPAWPEGYTTMSALNVKDYVLLHAGARSADRDSVDARIVNDVKNGTGGIIASQNDVGGWPNLAKNTRILTVPSNPNEVQASGYTKLEEWLHEFSKTVEGMEGKKPGRPGTFTY